MIMVFTLVKNIAIKEQTKKIAEDILEQITKDKNLLKTLIENKNLTLETLKEITNNAKLKSLIEQIKDENLLKTSKIYLFKNEKEKENELDNSMKILAEAVIIEKKMIGQKISGTFFVEDENENKKKQRKEKEEDVKKEMEKDIEFSDLIRKRKHIEGPTI